MNYSRDALLRFTDLLTQKGLANNNTAASLKVAVSKILSDLSPDEEADVRKVDVALAVRKFNNKNPNALSPNSLNQYQRRVANAIKEFLEYTENPTTYRGIGQPVKPQKGENGERQPRKKQPSADLRRAQDAPVAAAPPVPSAGLTMAFPLRQDFLAQLVLPRDLKTDEAKRLAAFIATLAVDYSPA